MKNLASLVSLVLCVYGLKAELIAHLHPPVPELVSSSCVFPFMYGDVVHYNCISTHSDYDWCSLDRKFQGRWRYCTGQDPPVCIFPFSFRNKLFRKCTKEGYILNRSWCSLTNDYDKDRKWKQCSPHECYKILVTFRIWGFVNHLKRKKPLDTKKDVFRYVLAFMKGQEL